MINTGLPFALVLELVSSRSRGIDENLTALALTLAVYQTAERSGFLEPTDPQRSVPRARKLTTMLGWHTQRSALVLGHSQAVCYGFFAPEETVKRPQYGTVLWRSVPLDVSWRGFRTRCTRGTAATMTDPFWVPEGCILDSKQALRTALLRGLFEHFATDDGQTGQRVWQTTRRQIAEQLGIVYGQIRMYIAQAGLSSQCIGHTYRVNLNREEQHGFGADRQTGPARLSEQAGIFRLGLVQGHHNHESVAHSSPRGVASN